MLMTELKLEGTNGGTVSFHKDDDTNDVVIMIARVGIGAGPAVQAIQVDISKLRMVVNALCAVTPFA